MEPKSQHYFQAISARSKVKKSEKISRDIPKEDTSKEFYHIENGDRDHRKKFCEFYLLLKEGFNIILSGFGSKRRLLNEFTEEWLKDERSLTIQGFFPELTSKMIISALKTLLNADGIDAQSLRSAAEKLRKDSFLVVHSIDRLLSSNQPSLNHLITSLILSSKGNLHLIATVDHVNSGFLWSAKDKNRLNLFYQNCPTFQSFRIERELMSTFNSEGSVFNDLNLSSVQHVYDSLTPNAKNIFRLILEHHVKNPETFKINDEPQKYVDDESMDSTLITARKRKCRKKAEVHDSELTFSALYKMCREKYLVNSEVTLRAQLTEFQDHKILKVAKQTDGVLTVNLLISQSLVNKFLETIEQLKLF